MLISFSDEMLFLYPSRLLDMRRFSKVVFMLLLNIVNSLAIFMFNFDRKT